MNQVEFLHSILEHNQFVHNMNTEINGMEKELMIQEHHVLIQEAKQEHLNEDVKALPAPKGKESFKTNLSNKANAIINKIKELLTKFKNWVTSTYKVMVSKVQAKLNSITKAVEGKAGFATAPYDFKASVTKFVALPLEAAKAVRELSNLGVAKDRGVVTNVATKAEAQISKLRKLGEMFTVKKETKYHAVNVPVLKAIGQNYVKGLNLLGKDMDAFIQQTTSHISKMAALGDEDLKYQKAQHTARLVSSLSSTIAGISGKAITQVNALTAICSKLGGSSASK